MSVDSFEVMLEGCVKVLGIVRSPHRMGNTEILTKYVLKEAKEEGAKTEMIKLIDFNINYCKGCHECLKSGICMIDDDSRWIIGDARIRRYSPSKSDADPNGIGSDEVFIDRLILLIFKQSLKGKYVVRVSVGGYYDAKK